MPWVRFVRAFDWDPPERRGLTTIAFAAGEPVCVRIACAAAAVAAGAAVRVKRPASDVGRREGRPADGRAAWRR